MSFDPQKLEAVCRTVHEALRAWTAAHGDDRIPPWNDAPAWLRRSVQERVLEVVQGGERSDRDLHEQWLAQKVREGWTYGPDFDAVKKTHPLLQSYDQLPDWDQKKSDLLAAIARVLA